MLISLDSSELRQGWQSWALVQKPGGLRWILENFVLAPKLLKRASHTPGLQSEYKYTSWKLFSIGGLSSGTCPLTNGALPLSYFLDIVNLAEYNTFANFPLPFLHASHLQIPRVNPQDNVSLEKKCDKPN